MTTTINGRTPDEIKQGLQYIAETNVTRKVDLIRTGIAYRFTEDIAADTLAYIQQLEARIDTLTAKAVLFEDAVDAGERMKRERDAAVKQLKDVDTVDLLYCSHCKHEELCDYNLNSCDDCEKDCPCHTCVDMCNWQWRGVQEGER